ncbi:hypothetical protein F4X86_00340 [Candidatus Saccharibacteria bacterium]|nr:hypothetical protein [Candidatus Saccharibacteria bacterium]
MNDGAKTTNGFTSPATQAMNLIRYIGNEISGSGEPIRQLSGISGIVGVSSEKLAVQMLEELYERGIIKMSEPTRLFEGTIFRDVNLTLDGWKQYEQEKRGGFDGNYGFLAMQFGEAELDSFVREVLKPAVKEGTDYELINLDDRSRAGVIDDIMRVQIRDAKFVIVDLTHDNNGAYWEAGYAEGLGKPVIYICEKKKFDEKKTHFDTNHCTTVPWSRDDDEGFCKKLVATLRRSLDEVS